LRTTPWCRNGTIARPLPKVNAAKYVGSQACASGHKDDHAEWKQTWHANMHRIIQPGIVIADFNNKEITYKEAFVFCGPYGFILSCQTYL
jgi:hypothetical protein